MLSTTITAAADCNSGKTGVAVSSQGTVAPLPSIGIVPSSPDSVESSSTVGQNLHPTEASVIDDHDAEVTLSKNDNQVCCSDCINL